MYGGMFNYYQEATWYTCHTHEQKFGDTQGLPAQNDFPYIFPKHL